MFVRSFVRGILNNPNLFSNGQVWTFIHLMEEHALVHAEPATGINFGQIIMTNESWMFIHKTERIVRSSQACSWSITQISLVYQTSGNIVGLCPTSPSIILTQLLCLCHSTFTFWISGSGMWLASLVLYTAGVWDPATCVLDFHKEKEVLISSIQKRQIFTIFY